MSDNHEQYMKRCYELAVSSGKKGHDTFGAVLVYGRRKILPTLPNGSSDMRNSIWYTNAPISIPMIFWKSLFYIPAVHRARDVWVL